MLFILVNRTRTDLSKDEFMKLGEQAKDFYAIIPDGVVLHNEWAALNQACTFALMEADDQSAIDTIQAPFRPYVDIDIVPVREISGWNAT